MSIVHLQPRDQYLYRSPQLRINTYTGREDISPDVSQREQILRGWKDSCNANNLDSVILFQGFHDVSLNMQRGFAWASQYDWIMNVDSDLLLTASFFSDMARDYAAARLSCGSPVISGFEPETKERSSVNFMFDRKTYSVLVEPAISGSYPWDDRLSEEHVRWCHGWPTSPGVSYIQHIEGLGVQGAYKGSGAQFRMDDFNGGLLKEIESFAPQGSESERRTVMANESQLAGYLDRGGRFERPVSPVDANFDGPHKMKFMRGCANAAALSPMERAKGQCLAFLTQEEAENSCLLLRDCGGLTQGSRDAKFELRRGGKGGAMADSRNPAEWSWMRKGFA